MTMKRAISVDQLSKMKFKTAKLEGKWADSFGDEVELSGSWIVWGESGEGKTAFCLQLAILLTIFGRVAYNSIEEGARLSFQMAVARLNFTVIQKRRFKILSEEIEDLKVRLRKQKAPDFIFIDSIQFSEITKSQFKQLHAEFPNKLFIWISHADGRKPLGAVAEFCKYKSDLKIFVQGFKATGKNRFEKDKTFIINENKAAEAWNEIL